MNKNILQELNICDVTKLELKEFQAEGYFDALHDLVNVIETRDFSFKNTDEQRKFYESIEMLKDFKNHELKFLNGGYGND